MIREQGVVTLGTARRFGESLRGHAHDRCAEVVVRTRADGARELSTGLGSLQPYARVNVYRASSGQDQVLFSTAAGSAAISSAAGYTSAELAGGFTWSLSPAVSVYGELGRVFDLSGDARVKSSIEGSGGLRVRW